MTPEKLEFYAENSDLVAHRFPSIQPQWFRVFNDGFSEGICVFMWLQEYICNIFGAAPSENNTPWNTIWNAITTSLEVQIAHLTKDLKNTDLSAHSEVIKVLKSSLALKQAYHHKKRILEVHDEMAIMEGPSIPLSSIPGITVNGDLVILMKFPSGPLVITYQMFVAILDKIEAALSWRFYVEYMDAHPMKQGQQYQRLFFDIYEVLERSYARCGNEAVRLFKLLEPLTVGMSLRLFDPVTNDHNFLTAVVSSLKERAPQLSSYLDEIVKIGTSYLQRHGEQGIPTLIEQFGQEKLHFYPIVSIEGGLKKMQEHGTAFRNVSNEAAKEIAGHFKREYFVAYYEKHKTPPSTHKICGVSKSLKKMLRTGNP